VTFEPGVTSKIIRLPILDDGVIEPTQTFTVNLSNAVGGVISDSQGTGTISMMIALSSFVVDDASTDRTYRYGFPGNTLGNSTIASGNTAPRGVASQHSRGQSLGRGRQ